MPVLVIPRVFRIRRRGGVLLQGCDYYIGRAVKRGGWNQFTNPFKRKRGLPQGSTLPAYERYVRSSPYPYTQNSLVSGKDTWLLV